MKTEVFEKAILKEGLEPVEVKLQRGQVMFFVAKSKSTDYVVIYNKYGWAYLSEGIDLNEAVNITYSDHIKMVVNGKEIKRIAQLNLFKDEN